MSNLTFDKYCSTLYIDLNVSHIVYKINLNLNILMKAVDIKHCKISFFILSFSSS